MKIKNSKRSVSEVFYDGECKMCQAFVGQIEKSSQNQEFITRDVTKGHLPKGTTKKEALNEIYVTDDRGTHRNANAILRILERFPRFRFFVWLGRLPIINHILTLGYFFISSHRHLLFGTISKLLWLKFVTILSLLLGVFLSLPLWIGERFFPTVPAFSIIGEIPDFLHVSVFLLLLSSLLVAFVFPRPHIPLFCFFVCAVTLSLTDQMRLQPWFYQYSFMLLLLALFSWNKNDHRGAQTTLDLMRILISGIYFYSGLQKLNPVFVLEIFPWLTQPILSNLDQSLFTFLMIVLVGSCIPLIEMGIGIGLLSRRFRRVAVVFAGAMFIFLLPTIGPFGHEWNTVVWPWNVAMLFFVVTLFWSNENTVDGKNFLHTMKNRLRWSQKLIALLFVFMPSLSFFGLWDSYPSFSLYSGNTTQGSILLADDSAQALPVEVQKFVKNSSDGTSRLDLRSWSFDELRVPIYPEERVYKHIFASLCKDVLKDGDLRLQLNVRPHTLNQNLRAYRCHDL